MEQLIIDDEFKNTIQPLSGEELEQLEANIKEHGCRDALVIWNNMIIDGHNRYSICQRNNIPFSTVQMDFPNRDTVKLWMLRNQLGRRNLNDFQRSEIALQLESLLKAQAKVRQGNRTDLEPESDTESESDFSDFSDFPQNSSECSAPPQKPQKAKRQERETRNAVAKTAGVSHDTIKKVKAIQATATPEIKELARSGSVSINAASKIAALPEDSQKEITGEIQGGTKPSEAVKKHVHVAQNSGENEWYTPAEFIEAARVAMGSIDLDPASSAIANETVKATTFFTKEDDGLTKEWHGALWCNPPYAQPLIANFAEAIASKYEAGEIQQACVLVNNATETKWFQRLLSVADAVCFPSSRIRFIRPDEKKGAPLQGQAIIYIGTRTSEFADAFSQFGAILPRIA
ncbi:DNA N-6-adenine-methyltransferase [Acidithiobacillus thiooxidans]|uniref:DNA N-6-adenine-methyltransferase n=1 Tax=Acidithiobacillus thiooxidans TaxID=930 RepID=UPI001C06ECD1|nr:DNA N-6-adenine-methyltransferase [Acidithiobacillus thiooxidans]MBU2843552.1 hypothetical protein [Acidithiobacillus thiooxidans]